MRSGRFVRNSALPACLAAVTVGVCMAQSAPSRKKQSIPRRTTTNVNPAPKELLLMFYRALHQRAHDLNVAGDGRKGFARDQQALAFKKAAGGPLLVRTSLEYVQTWLSVLRHLNTDPRASAPEVRPELDFEIQLFEGVEKQLRNGGPVRITLPAEPGVPDANVVAKLLSSPPPPLIAKEEKPSPPPQPAPPPPAPKPTVTIAMVCDKLADAAAKMAYAADEEDDCIAMASWRIWADILRTAQDGRESQSAQDALRDLASRANSLAKQAGEEKAESARIAGQALSTMWTDTLNHLESWDSFAVNLPRVLGTPVEGLTSSPWEHMDAFELAVIQARHDHAERLFKERSDNADGRDSFTKVSGAVLCGILADHAKHQAKQASEMRRPGDEKIWKRWEVGFRSLQKSTDPSVPGFELACMATFNSVKEADVAARAGNESLSKARLGLAELWQDLALQISRGQPLIVHFPDAMGGPPTLGKDGSPIRYDIRTLVKMMVEEAVQNEKNAKAMGDKKSAYYWNRWMWRFKDIEFTLPVRVKSAEYVPAIIEEALEETEEEYARKKIAAKFTNPEYRDREIAAWVERRKRAPWFYALRRAYAALWQDVAEQLEKGQAVIVRLPLEFLDDRCDNHIENREVLGYSMAKAIANRKDAEAEAAFEAFFDALIEGLTTPAEKEEKPEDPVSVVVMRSIQNERLFNSNCKVHLFTDSTRPISPAAARERATVNWAQRLDEYVRANQEQNRAFRGTTFQRSRELSASSTSADKVARIRALLSANSRVLRGYRSLGMQGVPGGVQFSATGGVEGLFTQLRSLKQSDVDQLMSRPNFLDQFAPYWLKNANGNPLAQAGISSKVLGTLVTTDPSRIFDESALRRIGPGLRAASAAGALSGGQAEQNRVFNQVGAYTNFVNANKAAFDSIIQANAAEARTGVGR